jgi:hypothetical protein
MLKKFQHSTYAVCHFKAKRELKKEANRSLAVGVRVRCGAWCYLVESWIVIKKRVEVEDMKL